LSYFYNALLTTNCSFPIITCQLLEPPQIYELYWQYASQELRRPVRKYILDADQPVFAVLPIQQMGWLILKATPFMV